MISGLYEDVVFMVFSKSNTINFKIIL